jgi:hypothetical protein
MNFLRGLVVPTLMVEAGQPGYVGFVQYRAYSFIRTLFEEDVEVTFEPHEVETLCAKAMASLKSGEVPVRVQAGLALAGLVALVDRQHVGALVPSMMQGNS